MAQIEHSRGATLPIERSPGKYLDIDARSAHLVGAGRSRGSGSRRGAAAQARKRPFSHQKRSGCEVPASSLSLALSSSAAAWQFAWLLLPVPWSLASKVAQWIRAVGSTGELRYSV